MFENTLSVLHRSRIEVILLSKLISIFETCAFAVGILYQIYMIASGSDIWYAHVGLLVLSTLHFIYKFVIADLNRSAFDTKLSRREKKHLKEEFKQKRRLERKIYKASSLIIRAFIIATSIYSIVVTPKVIKIIFTSLIIAELFVEIFIELVKAFIEKRIYDFKEAIDEDIAVIKDFLKTPVEKAKNVYNGFSENVAKTSNAMAKVISRIGKKVFGRKESYIESEDYTPLASDSDNKEEETV